MTHFGIAEMNLKKKKVIDRAVYYFFATIKGKVAVHDIR